MGILTQILGLLLSLTFLVFIHELGHYIFARIFKTRVDKFYLFFNPGFSILRAKNFSGKWHFSFFSSKTPEEWSEHPDRTEWGIGWLPLGGYCSINGMVDETTKPGELPAEPQPYEFRAKPAWQRFLIIIGGVMMNFLSALVIYGAVLFTWGQEYIPLSNAEYGLQFTNVGKMAGFEDGDKVISLDGKQPETIGDFLNGVLIEGHRHVEIDRNGQIINLDLSNDFPQQILAEGGAFSNFNFPFVVDIVVENSVAEKAGLRHGDSIVALNGIPYTSYFTLQEQLAENANKLVSIDYYRQGVLQEDSILLGDDGKLGVYYMNPAYYLPVKKVNYTFWESIPKGISQGFNTLGMYVKQFKLIATKEGAKQLGGFGTIGSIFPKVWDWQRFWSMTGFLAIILAFMNILPIPALDGGYLLFILVEMITRKKPSDKFIGYANAVGLSLLLLLVLYANGMDIIRAFIK